jgi:uncharacterized protein (TIGR02271 family)
MPKNFSNQVRDGMDVYDVNDDKVGTVHEVYDASGAEASKSGGGYLRVPTGFLGLGAEHHIPFSEIREVRNDNIYLSMPKERLDELGYDEAPVESDGGFDGDTVERTTSTTRTAMPRIDAPGERLTDDTARTLQLREEQLVARKRSVQTGEVGIRAEVVSEQRTLEVPVTHEEVTIERKAVDRRPSDRPITETSETISVPVSEEQVTLEKNAVVYEEVNVGKRSVQETQQLTETVRREEAVVSKEGDVTVDGDTPSGKPRP